MFSIINKFIDEWHRYDDDVVTTVGLDDILNLRGGGWIIIIVIIFYRWLAYGLLSNLQKVSFYIMSFAV